MVSDRFSQLASSSTVYKPQFCCILTHIYLRMIDMLDAIFNVL